REPAHRRVEALVLLHLVAVPADHLGRLLDVAERLETVLADLVRHERGQVEQPLLHHVGDVPEDPHPLPPADPIPFERERLRRLHGVLDVLGGRLGEAPDRERLVDRRGLVVPVLAPALFAVDDDRILLAELAPHPLGGLVVVALQVLVVGRQGRVGDPEFLRHGRCPPSMTDALPERPGTLGIVAVPLERRPRSSGPRHDAAAVEKRPPSVLRPTLGRTLRLPLMRLVTYDRGGQRRLGAILEGEVVDLPDAVGHPAFPTTLEGFVASSRGTVMEAAYAA